MPLSLSHDISHSISLKTECVNVNIYTYINTHTTHKYIYIYIYVHIYIYTYIHTYIHTLHYITLRYITLHYITLHTYIYIYAYVYVYVYMWMYMYVCIYTLSTIQIVTSHPDNDRTPRRSIHAAPGPGKFDKSDRSQLPKIGMCIPGAKARNQEICRIMAIIWLIYGSSKEVSKWNFRQYGQLEKQRWEESERRKEKQCEERRCRCATIHCVFTKICGFGGSKSNLAKAAGAETSGQMRDEKLHAIVMQNTFPSQHVQNTPTSDHFFKLSCQEKCTPSWHEAAHFQVKSVESCGFWTVRYCFAWQAQSEQNVRACSRFKYNHQYTTLH